uniref:Uncharacterized protein n=2 Tax=Schistocephalus solidus TaxID=70667 RepID=A0A0X3PBX4_SCHSO
MSAQGRQRLTPQEEAVLQAFNNLNARLQNHLVERKDVGTGMSPRISQYCPASSSNSNHPGKSASCVLSKTRSLPLADARQSKTSDRGKHVPRELHRHRSKEARPQPPPLGVNDLANVYAKTTPTLRKKSVVHCADPAPSAVSHHPVLRNRLLPSRPRHFDRGPLVVTRRKIFEVPVAAVDNEPAHIFKISSIMQLLPAWEPCSNSE